MKLLPYYDYLSHELVTYYTHVRGKWKMLKYRNGSEKKSHLSGFRALLTPDCALQPKGHCLQVVWESSNDTSDSCQAHREGGVRDKGYFPRAPTKRENWPHEAFKFIFFHSSISTLQHFPFASHVRLRLQDTDCSWHSTTHAHGRFSIDFELTPLVLSSIFFFNQK